jgi:DNA-binding CsgD family transcriptional regulator
MGPHVSLDVLSQALDITLAEARVLYALATGVSLNEFSLGCGVSVHTVCKQVATMMAKMDCTRQVELVRAALLVGQ